MKRTGCDLRPSDKPGDLPALSRAAVDEGFERIVVAGGDGTISEALNGIAPDFDRVEVAVLPFGTGNDFARSLGIPLDEASLRDYLSLETPPVRVDLVKVQGRGAAYFANAANGGLGGSVAREIESETKQRWGPIAYWMTAVSTAIDHPVYNARIELDGQVLEQEITAIAIANGRYVGGGFPVAPDALIDDGLLDVVVVPPLPVLDLAASSLNFALHRNDLATDVGQYRCRRVHVQARPQLPFSIDGEPGSTFDATFDIVPRALRVIPGPIEPALSSRQPHA